MNDMEMVTRSEAEELIKEAIDDYLDVDSLQEIMSIISDGDEFMVVEDSDETENEEDYDQMKKLYECKSCDYPAFNNDKGTCPNCGSGLISETHNEKGEINKFTFRLFTPFVLQFLEKMA